MQPPTPPPPPAQSPPPGPLAGPPPAVGPHLPARPLPAAVGWLLVVPAGLATLIGYAWPTIRTAWWSLRAGNPLTESNFVGMDNYQRVATAFDGWLGPLWYALTLAVPLVFVLVVVAPLLAIAAHFAGRPARLTVRLALTVPMVCFVPVALALGWRFDRLTGNTLDGAASGVRAAVWLSLFGLVCGLATVFYLAAFRRRQAGARWAPWSTAGTLAVLANLAGLAVGLQVFTYPYVMTGGGPGRSTATPMLEAFAAGLQRLDFGVGAAQAMVLLVPLMLLGVGAALVVILTGLRMDVEPREPREPGEQPAQWHPVRVIALAGTGVLLLAVLAVTVYGLWPWLTNLGFGRAEGAGEVASMLARTWLPPVLSTVVGVGLAAVAAFGIGAVRPLGRWSELLLLPFAPWLFVGVGPLFLAKYDSAAFGLVDRIDNALGWIPPVWLVVPALFLFTLLFRGLASRPLGPAPGPPAGQLAGPPLGQPGQPGQPGLTRPAYGRMVLLALPMVALVAVATWLVQAQSLLWPLLVSRQDLTAPLSTLRLTEIFATSYDQIGYGLVLPVPLILVLALGLGLAQLLYLDRLSIRVDLP